MSLQKFLNPKNDVAFKRIFGTEKNKDILIHFLNDMITFKEKKPIVSVTFLKTIQDPEIASQKTSIVDILCEDENKNQYIVEMQVADTKGFEKRAQYYASKAYSSQANIGDDYGKLKEVIFLAIADFIMFPNKPGYKSDHIILDKKSNEHDLRDFSFTFIELPKFNKEMDDLHNMTEKWIYFFKHAEASSSEEKERLVGHDEILDKAYEELDRFAWNKVELNTYEQSEKRRRDYMASLAFKEEKGRAEGRAEGKAEEKLEIARKLMRQKIDISVIAEVTGLREDEIKNISA